MVTKYSGSISIAKPTRCTKFILFWNDAIHVSGGHSVNHQEFKTVHTARDICQTDTAICFLAGTSMELVLFRTH